MTITLDGLQILTLIATVFSCALNIFVAMIGFNVKRANKPIAIFFVMSFLGLAWITLFVGLSNLGFGQFYPPIVVLAPMLSGYILVSFYLFCRSVVFPSEPPPLKLYGLGVFGTLFSFAVLSKEGGAQLIHQLMMNLEVDVWSEPAVLALFCLHSIALLILLSLIFRVLYQGARITKDRDQHEARKSLLIATFITIVVYLLTNLAPIFGLSQTICLAPFSTLLIAWVARRLLKTVRSHTRPDIASAAATSTRLESLSRMARGIAHDFNNTLAGLVGHAELAMLKLNDTQAAKLHLQTIVQMGQHAAGLTHNLISLSVNGSSNAARIQIGSLTRNTIDALRSSICADVKLYVEIDDSLPMIAISETAYAAALMNLILNARAALDKELREISVSLVFEKAAAVPDYALGERLDTRPSLRLEVIDNGAGMTTEIQDHIYEPFFSTKPQGKGLGLTNVLSTVREASGAIACESSVDVGTVFRIWFPVEEQYQAQNDEQSDVVARKTHSSKCILVEDDVILSDTLVQMIESLGYGCEHFTTGERALNYFRRQLPTDDILICDVGLPGMSGIELVEALNEFVRLPTLVISGNQTPESVHQLSEVPNLLFLRKPVTRLQLHEALSKLRHLYDRNRETMVV